MYGSRRDSLTAEVISGSGYEKSTSLVYNIKSAKISIPFVENIVSAWFETQLVKSVYIVYARRGDMNEHWNGSFYIEKRVQLYCSFGFSESCPPEDA
jgi:hypothetical protein